MYKAKIDIGEYKKGEEVPEVKALFWNSVYKIAPTELVKGEEVKPVVKPVENSNSSMNDDYLNRNKNVVLNSLEEDNLPENILNSMFELEENNKNRNAVKRAIKDKIKNLGSK